MSMSSIYVSKFQEIIYLCDKFVMINQTKKVTIPIVNKNLFLIETRLKCNNSMKVC